jgi:hypothetical protein
MMEPSIVLGHLALHYRPGDEAPARQLLELLGCTLVDNGPAPGSDGFCTVLLDKGTANYADNLMFLSPLPPAQVAVEDAIRAALAVGQTDEADLVARLRGLTATAPEALSHIGMRYRSFDDLERVLVALDAAAAPGGALEGRVEVVKHRARPGLDAAVDARMAASAVFAGTEKPAFADHWVQCFVNTDLCGFGVLAFGSTFELDYVFDQFMDHEPSFGTRR